MEIMARIQIHSKLDTLNKALARLAYRLDLDPLVKRLALTDDSSEYMRPYNVTHADGTLTITFDLETTDTLSIEKLFDDWMTETTQNVNWNADRFIKMKIEVDGWFRNGAIDEE